MRKRTLLLAALAALFLALTSCSPDEGQVAGAQATPARTVRPVFTSTTTPTATVLPSDTPRPTETAVPTDTPLPPTGTPPPADTPAPEMPTETPTGEAPSPTSPPPPTATTAPQPQPTSPPPPPTATARPKVDFRVAEIVAFVDGSLTASGLHNIYFTVVDAGGAPLDGIILEEVNNQPPVQVTTGNKGPGKTEFTMWAADYRFKVVGNTGGQALSSDTTHVLSVLQGHAVWEDLIRGGICTDASACQAMGSIHYSYRVTFQRTW